jgi:hypothetical protein
MTEGDLLREDPSRYGAGRAGPAQEYLRELDRALGRGDATEHTQPMADIASAEDLPGGWRAWRT